MFAVIQFLITPLILAIENKVSKPFLFMMVLYSSNVFLIPYLTQNIESWPLTLIITAGYNLAFLAVTGIFLGWKNLVLFFRFLLYGIYTLTWIPITIQGIWNKNNKEWSHTKHVRKIEICDV